MRNALFIGAVLSCFVISLCCNNNAGSKTDSLKFDSSGRIQYRTPGLYADVEKNDVLSAILWVLLQEVYAPILTDTTFHHRKWEERKVIDTAYFLPKLVKDSTGKDTIINVPINFYSVSLDKNVDSGAAKLRRYMNANPKIYPPKDSLKAVQNSLNSKVPK